MSEPTPDPALGGQAIPTTPCDVCGVGFMPGDVWNYHARLGVYVHTSCAANGPVRGEDITTHTVLWGQVPAAPEVTPAVRRAAEAMEDAALRLTGRDLGTIYRDRIAREGLAAGLGVEEMARVLNLHASFKASAEIQDPNTPWYWECDGCDARLALSGTYGRADVIAALAAHQAAALRTALLGPDVVWQGDGVRAVASDLVAVDEGDDDA
jgi:hypothetical protein